MKSHKSTDYSSKDDKPLITKEEEDSIYESLKNLSSAYWSHGNINAQSPEHHLKLCVKLTIEAHRLFRKNKKFFEGEGICLSDSDHISHLLCPEDEKTKLPKGLIGEYILFARGFTSHPNPDLDAIRPFFMLAGDCLIELCHDIAEFRIAGFDKVKDAFLKLQDALNSNVFTAVDDLCADLYATATVTSAMLSQFELTQQKLFEEKKSIVPKKDKEHLDREREKKRKNRKRPKHVSEETQANQFAEAIKLANDEYRKVNGHSDVWICKEAWKRKGGKRGYKTYKSLLSKFNRFKRHNPDKMPADERK